MKERPPGCTRRKWLTGMGILPQGMYRNRNFAEPHTVAEAHVSRAIQDLLYDPQTSGGLLLAVAEKDAEALLHELEGQVPHAAIIGYVTEEEDAYIILE